MIECCMKVDTLVVTLEHFCVVSRGGHAEKQDKHQNVQNEKLKPKVRRCFISKSDEPDQLESAFWKKILAYQRKLLV